MPQTFFSINDYYISHHGVKGQKWGVRRYRNEDGTLTEAGKRRYEKALSRYGTVGKNGARLNQAAVNWNAAKANLSLAASAAILGSAANHAISAKAHAANAAYYAENLGYSYTDVASSIKQRNKKVKVRTAMSAGFGAYAASKHIRNARDLAFLFNNADAYTKTTGVKTDQLKKGISDRRKTRTYSAVATAIGTASSYGLGSLGII